MAGTNEAHSENENRQELRFLILACTAALFVALLRSGWFADDAYVVFRSVYNLGHGFGLTFNPIERVQAFGSPLWAVLLAIPAALRLSIPACAMAFNIWISLYIFVVLAKEARSVPGVVFAFLTCLGSHAFIDYSTSGLENALAHLLLVIAAREGVRSGDLSAHPRRFGLLCALLALTQPGLLFILLPQILVFAGRRNGAETKRFAAGLWPLALWILFSIWYYGFYFPTTTIARFQAGAPGWEFLKQGLLYLLDLCVHDPISAFIIGLGIAAPLAAGSRITRMLSAGIALHLLFVAATGGDLLSGRAVSADFILSLLIVLQFTSRLAVLSQRAIVLVALVLGFLAPESNFTSASLAPGGEIRPSGIKDGRRAAQPASSVGLLSRLSGVPAIDPNFINVLKAQTQAAILENPGPIGFATGPEFIDINPLADTDLLLSRLPLDGGPWRIGGLYRSIPLGYMESIKSGKNQLAERDLGAYYQNLLEITRGPLWSLQRFGLIAQAQIGSFEPLLAAYRGTAPKVVKVASLQTFRAPGTPWNVYGAIPVRAGGLVVEIGKKIQAIGLEMSMGSGGIYQLSFRLKGKEMGTETVEPAQKDPGILVPAQVRVPDDAIENGFDTIVIRNLGTRPDASIGHLMPVE